MVREVLTRPYPVSIPTVVPMVTLMLLVPFRGGHLWVGHHEELMAEIARFVRSAA
jgi:hypothetical protein